MIAVCFEFPSICLNAKSTSELYFASEKVHDGGERFWTLQVAVNQHVVADLLTSSPATDERGSCRGVFHRSASPAPSLARQFPVFSRY